MSTRAEPVDPGWRSGDILRAAAIVAGVYVALQLLWVGRSVFLIGFFGILLGPLERQDVQLGLVKRLMEDE